MGQENVFRMQIQDLTRNFAQENDFIFFKKTGIIRLVNNIIHIISFDFPPSGMQCYIALQPLYIPEENIHFSFGERLNFLNVSLPGLWGLERDRVHDDIKEINHLLHLNALPLFSKVYSPSDLISFISGQQITTIKSTPFLTNLYLAFSYLMINEYELSLIPLMTALDLTQDFIGVYREKNENLISNALYKIRKQEFSSIKSDLSAYISLTKENCNLNKIL